MSNTKKKVGKKRTTKRKAANRKTTGRRERIDRPYPRVALEKALQIPFVIKDNNGGNPWSPDDVATAVGLSKKNPDFFYMAKASREFGLTEGSRDTSQISLTELGRELVYAPNKNKEQELKLRAFLNVDLFKRVLDYYKGSNLPEMRYLSNTLASEFGLHPETHEEFSDLFGQNCKYIEIGTGLAERGITPQVDSKSETDTRFGEGQSIVTLVEKEDDSAPLCFVIMPFAEKDGSHPPRFFDEVLNSLIVPAGSEAGFMVKTAKRSGSDVIQATIVNSLLEADLVVADLTEHNPNVLFELGMRMAENKPVALIRAKGTKAIFDVDNMLRVYEYDPNLWLRTIKDDLPRLTKHIRAAWDQRESDQTYMKILRRSEQLRS